MKSQTIHVKLAACAVSAAIPFAHAHAVETSDMVAHEVLVKFKPGARAADLEAAMPGLSIKSRSSNLSLVRLVPSGALLYRSEEARAATLSLVQRLRARPDVEYAQPNYLFSLSHVPNDRHYSKQWHYPMINLPAAWDITRGNSTVKIAILDTGRTYHPELEGKWLPNEFNAYQPWKNATDGSNWRHGTHVAGIAAANSNNNIGGAGVCHNCVLLNAKVNDNNSSRIPLYYAVSGIDWAIANGASVINMSFEFEEPCTPLRMPAMRDAVARAVANNITVVAAAGNGRADRAGSMSVDDFSPASCPGAISVAATDRGGKFLSGFSNGGPNTGVTAPGGGWDPEIHPTFTMTGAGIDCPADGSYYPFDYGAFSTWTSTPASGNVHCYRYLSGTSMSAPHVSGTVGLMLSVNPALTPAQVKWILQSTATPMPLCGPDCGPGLLNASLAVATARDMANP